MAYESTPIEAVTPARFYQKINAFPFSITILKKDFSAKKLSNKCQQGFTGETCQR